MFNILFFVMACFFAAFGVVQFFDILIKDKAKANSKIMSVIPLHNNEEEAEGLIRSAFLNHDKIIAVDYGSFDNTVEILNSLKDEFPGLYVLTQEEFIEYLKDLDYVERNEL